MSVFRDRFSIASRWIGRGEPPFLVAEMSGNHNQSLDKALELVHAAHRAGVDALKLQTYTPDMMTLDMASGDFVIDDPNSLWNGYSLYELYRKAHTPREWHAPIVERCRKLGLLVFSSPFSEEAVDFLETLDMPCYKIASFENVDLKLVRKAARTGKPLLVSTGLASMEEIDDAVNACREEGCRDLVLLKCTSAYPAEARDLNLKTLEDLKKRYECVVGFSDHTSDWTASIAACALGASVIEKHFTLRRAEGGVDAAFSLEPEEMLLLNKSLKETHAALGDVFYGATPNEKSSMRFRRSLYVSRDIHKGERIEPDSIRVIRPGHGLTPKYWEQVIGRKALRDLPRGTPLRSSDFE